MRILKLNHNYTIYFLIFVNSLFIQTNQKYKNKKNHLFFNSEEEYIYLKEAFKDKLKIGSMVSFAESDKGEDFIKNNFDIITPAYELLPDLILNQNKSMKLGENKNPQVEFSSSTRKLLEFCENNKIPINGHTFIWYSQTPNWFFKENFNTNEKYVTKDIMDERLENFIKNTFALLEEEFPNLEINSYNVVNEVFLNEGGGLRKESESNWVKIYGDDSFVINAFTYARKYAPEGCKLLMSDYNEYLPDKKNDIYNIALRLKELEIIDGIGMESHLFDNFPSFDDYKIAFEKFWSSGLKIFITELDINANDLEKQCNFYKNLFFLYLDNRKYIESIILSATTDRWLPIRQSNACLFNINYIPKQSYFCVIETIIDDNK